MHFKEYKSILSAQNGMNIYRGCSHNCIYCDSRSRCYQMEHDFEDIEVKKDAPNMLKKALGSKRNRCMIGTGAMCDPYIPLEKELEYMRRCLEVICEYEFGVTILTKSDLILRDLDLLKNINEKTKCVVQMTLTTFDEMLCGILEPDVCSTKRRFEVLKIMRDNGIPTVVWLCPLLPFINDTEENLRGILDYCLEAQVYGIINFGFGLTLREGNREYFYNKLDEHFPGLKQKYIQKFGDSYVLNSENSKKLSDLFYKTCSQNNIETDINKIFEYLKRFEQKENEQLSLF